MKADNEIFKGVSEGFGLPGSVPQYPHKTNYQLIRHNKKRHFFVFTY